MPVLEQAENILNTALALLMKMNSALSSRLTNIKYMPVRRGFVKWKQVWVSAGRSNGLVER